ncbi:hypothetical protein ACWKWU_14630 [Chitinophaga lutea]
MKKIALFIFLALAAHTGFAQDSLKTKWKDKQMADLKLDDKQSKDIREINKAYLDKMQGMRKLNPDQKKAKLEALQADRDAKIKSVLNEEQYAKWQANREKSHARTAEYKTKQHRKEGGKKLESREDAVKALGLTDAQGQQLKSINQEFMSKLKALRDQPELTKEKRQEQMKSLNEERLGKIKLALGDTQYQKYNQWREQERAQFKSMRKKNGMEEKMKKKEAADKL